MEEKKSRRIYGEQMRAGGGGSCVEKSLKIRSIFYIYIYTYSEENLINFAITPT